MRFLPATLGQPQPVMECVSSSHQSKHALLSPPPDEQTNGVTAHTEARMAWAVLRIIIVPAVVGEKWFIQYMRLCQQSCYFHPRAHGKLLVAEKQTFLQKVVLCISECG